MAGLEINAELFLIGLTRMLLAGIETPYLEQGNSLEREAMSSPSRHGFDVVLANPPIGAKNSREPWRYQHFPILTNDSAGSFIQHALSQLKPQGRAVIAVPEGFLFRGGAVRELRRLPDGTRPGRSRDWPACGGLRTLHQREGQSAGAHQARRCQPGENGGCQSLIRVTLRPQGAGDSC